jgi:hypothetical protein
MGPAAVELIDKIAMYSIDKNRPYQRIHSGLWRDITGIKLKANKYIPASSVSVIGCRV